MKRNVLFLVCLYFVLFVLVVFIIFKLTGIVTNSGGKIFAVILSLQLMLVLVNRQHKKSMVLFYAKPVEQLSVTAAEFYFDKKQKSMTGNEYTISGIDCIGCVEDYAFVFKRGRSV